MTASQMMNTPRRSSSLVTPDKTTLRKLVWRHAGCGATPEQYASYQSMLACERTRDKRQNCDWYKNIQRPTPWVRGRGRMGCRRRFWNALRI